MTIWALSDLHLAFSVPDKDMKAFGPSWENYAEKMGENWRRLVHQDDLVLIPGDISWAMRLEEALVDLKWIDALPGTKVMVKGNHDYWWGTVSKMRKAMPSSIHLIQNDVFNWNDVTIGGTRLWDSDEYSFNTYIQFQENPLAKPSAPFSKEEAEREREKIFSREKERLKLSLTQLRKDAPLKIVLTHYPPIGADLKPSQVSSILEAYGVNICVFGHLHNLKKPEPFLPLFGTARGVEYIFASCDYLDFTPLRVHD
jgi:uncharacterized protein